MKTQNGEHPFALVRHALSKSIVCVNLEAALRTEGSREKEKTVSVFVDSADLSRLDEHVDIVSLVNNHVHDTNAADELRSRLEAAGMHVIGPRNPAKIEINVPGGKRVAIFSAYFRLPRFSASYGGKTARRLYRDIRSTDADVKVVYLHWGFEYTTVPAPFQRKIARRFIDLGADLVIGHHPHVAQGWETYRSKHIFYSLGNFNFSTEQGKMYEDSWWGYMVEMDLDSSKVTPIPYRINENFQPWLDSCDEKVQVLDKIQILCERAEDEGYDWYSHEYSAWYCWERGQWRADLQEKGGIGKRLQYLAWLCLPINLNFYWYQVKRRLANCHQ